MKISLISLHGKMHGSSAGASKVFFAMANYLAQNHDVQAIYSDSAQGEPFFYAEPQVNLINLNAQKKFPRFKLQKIQRELYRGLSRIGLMKNYYDPVLVLKQKLVGRALRELLDDFSPDVVVAFGVSDLMSLNYSGAQYPVTLMCHSDAHRIYSNLTVLEKKALKTVERVQVLLPEYVSSLKGLNTNVVVIGNVVPQFETVTDSAQKKIIYLARVEKNKNQHLIVNAFASVDPQLRKDWQVEFYGSVSDQTYLADMNMLISQYGLIEQIRYCGATERPYEVLSSASICAFPSLNEGFPLAMTEAMSLGLAPIGLKSCSGVNQLIVDGHNGKLASTPDDFAAALEALMRDDELRKRFGLQAKEDVAQYSEASVWGAWERELLEFRRLK